MFDFKLDIGNAGALLDRVGLPRTLADGHGSVTGKVGWRGGPTALDFRRSAARSRSISNTARS